MRQPLTTGFQRPDPQTRSRPTRSKRFERWCLFLSFAAGHASPRWTRSCDIEVPQFNDRPRGCCPLSWSFLIGTPFDRLSRLASRRHSPTACRSVAFSSAARHVVRRHDALGDPIEGKGKKLRVLGRFAVPEEGPVVAAKTSTGP